MKFFLFIFFLFPFLISAPLSKEHISGTHSAWSAGVCCQTGTDYELNFSLKTKKANRITLDSVCLDGHLFKKLRIKKDDNNKLTSYTVKFTYRQDNIDENNREEQENNDISRAPIYASCSGQILHYSYRGKKYKVELPILKKNEQLPRP
jgi:hypothetical protein